MNQADLKSRFKVISQRYTQYPDLDSLSGMYNVKDYIEKHFIDYFKEDEPTPLSKKFHTYFFYGIPGFGKTLLTKALLKKLASFKVFCIPGSTIATAGQTTYSHYVNSAFEAAKEKSPAVFWFDEVDDISLMNEQQLNKFSQTLMNIRRELSNEDNDIKVKFIFSSNYPQKLNDQIYKAFEAFLEFGPPDYHERLEQFQMSLAKRDHCVKSEQMEILARNTEGFSQMDIEQAVSQSSRKIFLNIIQDPYVLPLNNPIQIGGQKHSYLFVKPQQNGSIRSQLQYNFVQKALKPSISFDVLNDSLGETFPATKLQTSSQQKKFSEQIQKYSAEN